MQLSYSLDLQAKPSLLHALIQSDLSASNTSTEIVIIARRTDPAGASLIVVHAPDLHNSLAIVTIRQSIVAPEIIIDDRMIVQRAIIIVGANDKFSVK